MPFVHEALPTHLWLYPNLSAVSPSGARLALIHLLSHGIRLRHRLELLSVLFSRCLPCSGTGTLVHFVSLPAEKPRAEQSVPFDASTATPIGPRCARLGNSNTGQTATITHANISTVANRRTSQKPSDELYRNFKADFPQLSTTAAPPPSASSSAAPPQHSQPDAQTLPTTSLAEALDVPINPR